MRASDQTLIRRALGELKSFFSCKDICGYCQLHFFLLMSFPHYGLEYCLRVVLLSEKIGKKPHFQGFFRHYLYHFD